MAVQLKGIHTSHTLGYQENWKTQQGSKPFLSPILSCFQFYTSLIFGGRSWNNAIVLQRNVMIVKVINKDTLKHCTISLVLSSSLPHFVTSLLGTHMARVENNEEDAVSHAVSQRFVKTKLFTHPFSCSFFISGRPTQWQQLIPRIFVPLKIVTCWTERYRLLDTCGMLKIPRNFVDNPSIVEQNHSLAFLTSQIFSTMISQVNSRVNLSYPHYLTLAATAGGIYSLMRGGEFDKRMTISKRIVC